METSGLNSAVQEQQASSLRVAASDDVTADADNLCSAEVDETSDKCG